MGTITYEGRIENLRRMIQGLREQNDRLLDAMEYERGKKRRLLQMYGRCKKRIIRERREKMMFTRIGKASAKRFISVNRRHKRLLKKYGEMRLELERSIRHNLKLDATNTELANRVQNLHGKVIAGRDQSLLDQLDWQEKRIEALQQDPRLEHERQRADYFEQLAENRRQKIGRLQQEVEQRHEAYKQGHEEGYNAAFGKAVSYRPWW